MSRDHQQQPGAAQGQAGATSSHSGAASDEIAKGHLAVQHLEGGVFPRISTWAATAIEQQNFVAARAAAMQWYVNKPFLRTLAQSLDPRDRQVVRAQALLNDMAPLEAQLPDLFEVGFMDDEAATGRARWLARIGGAAPRKEEAAQRPRAATETPAAPPEAPPALQSPLRPENIRPDWLDWRVVATGVVGVGVIAWAEMERMQGNPVTRVPADIIHALVTSPEYTSGFAVGGVEGVWAALKDNAAIFVDIYDLVKDLVKTHLVSGDLGVLLAVRDKIMELIAAGRQVPAAISAFAERWNDNSDLHAQGHFQGHAVGYIAVQVLALVIGAIAPGGQYADVIRILKLATDPLGGLLEVATTAKAARAAKAATTVEHAVDGAVVGERAGLHAAEGAAAGERRLGSVFEEATAGGNEPTRPEPHAAGQHTQESAATATDHSVHEPTRAQEPTISASRAAEINFGIRDITSRQQAILAELPDVRSRFIDHKRRIRISDLADLTAKTGDEFTIFTRGPQRLIIRGDSLGVPLTVPEIEVLRDAGWRWSGHTHPGTSDLVLDASGHPGDRLVLEIMGQDQSLIMNSRGSRNLFDQADNTRIPERSRR
ncbi:MAG: hypothetical protein IPL61_27445 [Myxococcales bacterium]|nr:hypothetical protein [Myxococcales bacterium]